jgi:hypothetical protein
MSTSKRMKLNVTLDHHSYIPHCSPDLHGICVDEDDENDYFLFFL